MRKIFLAIILFISGISYAFHFEGVGNRTFIDNDGDTLFIFETTPEFESKIGPIDWYRLPDTTKAFTENAEEFTLAEHGEGYAIKVNGVWEYFWVFEYEQLRPQVNGVEAILSCTETVLDIEGTIPVLQYTDTKGMRQTIERMCTVTYTDAVWGESAWMDSVIVNEMEWASSLTVAASPVATDYVIEDKWALDLGLEDSIPSSEYYDPIALKTHPVTVTTTRGKDGVQSNEIQRPIDPNQSYLIGTSQQLSGQLEVLFRANGINADYYDWKIYSQDSTLLLSRKEPEHRYTFVESGVYKVILQVSNAHCQPDSIVFEVMISDSYLEVPNTFTPNGDGANDEFKVIYKSIKEFHCWIYNRWGKLVYKWDDPAEGWDGTINGRPAAVGAYYYVIRALGTDATQEEYISKIKYTIEQKEGNTPPNSGPDVTYMGVYQRSGVINLLR
jgi:gliding motility-associated-like protein